MLTEINGTIRIAGDKIVLVIDGYEEFKKYKDVDRNGDTIDDKFYAGYTLDNKQLYVTGLYPQGELGDDIIIDVKFVGEKGGKYHGRLEEMKNLLGLNDRKEEVVIKDLSKHPITQLLEEKNAEKTTLEEQLKKKGEELETAKKTIEEKVEELETAKKEAEEKLKQELEKEKEKLKAKTQDLQAKLTGAENKQQELQTQLNTANTEKTDLQQQSEAIDVLFTEELNGEIKGLIGSTDQDLKEKVKDLYDGKLKSTIKDIIGNNLSKMKDEDKEKLHEGLQIKIESMIGTDQSKNVDEIVELIKEGLKNSIINANKFSKEVADLKVELEAKEKQIKTLEAEKNKAKQEKQNLEAEKNKAKAQITTLNTEVKKLKAIDSTMLQQQLKNKDTEIQRLQKENKELEAKNKTPEQPKQSNAARYTAGIGMGLAAGLIAFTALERTVRLEMLVMIGIAVTSALVVGGITYAVLPGTQVDGAKAQEVNENGKGK